MIKYFARLHSGLLEVGIALSIRIEKEMLIIELGHAEVSTASLNSIVDCVVQMDKQIIFKIRNGKVVVGLDEVIENIMVNSDEFDIKQQTNAVMESYIEHTKLLDISKANVKAFYKQVAKDEELLMKLKKSDTVDELIEIAKDKLEHE